MSPFKREIRYDVTKLKTGKKVTCVVVEADWPEYEIVWTMLQDRMEGKPNRIAQLEQQLTAEREAKEKAEEERDGYKAGETLHFDIAKSAEQKLCEMREQESIGTVVYSEFNGYRFVTNPDYASVFAGPVYVAPIPPADIAELQRKIKVLEVEISRLNKVVLDMPFRSQLERENAELRAEVTRLSGKSGFCPECEKFGKENAKLTDEVEQRGKAIVHKNNQINELKRKLAEQQAVIKRMIEVAWVRWGKVFQGIEFGDSTELTKLLEEAKRQAVPERGQLKAAYEAGWRTAANWTERDDLVADIGSPAYLTDQDAALAELFTSPQPEGVDK